MDHRPTAEVDAALNAIERALDHLVQGDLGSPA
jgi:hypothetical protein